MFDVLYGIPPHTMYYSLHNLQFAELTLHKIRGARPAFETSGQNLGRINLTMGIFLVEWVWTSLHPLGEGGPSGAFVWGTLKVGWVLYEFRIQRRQTQKGTYFCGFDLTSVRRRGKTSNYSSSVRLKVWKRIFEKFEFWIGRNFHVRCSFSFVLGLF